MRNPVRKDLVLSMLRDDEWEWIDTSSTSMGLRRQVLVAAAAKLLKMTDVYALEKWTPAFEDIDLESMRGEPWIARAFEELARAGGQAARKIVDTKAEDVEHWRSSTIGDDPTSPTAELGRAMVESLKLELARYKTLYSCNLYRPYA